MVASRSTGSTFTADLHSLPSDWRRELHRLTALSLPLLPCGAGKEKKGPIDPATGYGLEGWQSAAFTVAQILAMNGAVRSVGSRTGAGLQALDIDGATALELCLAQGCDPQQARTWQVHRDTDPCRLKVLWRLTPEQQQELGEVSKKAQTKEPTRNEAGEVLDKGEAVEVFHHNGRQVLLLGQHVPSGGRYLWPDGCGPEALALIPPAWWELVRAIAAGNLGIKPQAAKKVSPRSSSRSSSGWRAVDPCPICGRNTTAYCSRNTSSGTIRCFHGNTFSPEISHGALVRGGKVQGTDGVLYGYAGTATQSNGDVFSTFVVHKEPCGRAAAADNRPADVDGAGQEQQDTGKAKCQDLELIRAAADQVVAEDINRSRPQFLHRLRELVEADLSVPARDDLYRREIGEAIIRRDGIESKPFVGGCELPDDDDEWLIEGLILAGALNIIGADPKAGKTLFSVALLAALLHGCSEFIGQSFTSRPETIIIVGPDQPVKLWKRQLQAVGLVDGNTLDRRIVRLWDSHNPWAATPEGIAELRQVCADHPESLVLVDSFAKVSEKLGIDENSREAAEVLTDIERACIVHGCTPLVIHHNAKAAGRIGIVNGAALRGSAAIRANSSQSLIMTLIEPDNPKDPRRRLVTEGRGTLLIDNVIELEDNGRSWRHVCEFSEHRSAAKVEKAREKLTARQAEALHALEGSSEPLTTAQVWAAAYPGEPWDKAANECKQLSRTLGQLADKRLATRHPGTANRPLWSA